MAHPVRALHERRVKLPALTLPRTAAAATAVPWVGQWVPSSFSCLRRPAAGQLGGWHAFTVLPLECGFALKFCRRQSLGRCGQSRQRPLAEPQLQLCFQVCDLSRLGHAPGRGLLPLSYFPAYKVEVIYKEETSAPLSPTMLWGTSRGPGP